MATNALRFLDNDSLGLEQPLLDVKCVLNKEVSVRNYVNYMLDRTNSMFEYDGLPDTIPAYILELYLQIFGYAAFVEVKETNPVHTPQQINVPAGLYIFFGGIGGERDIYYRPKLFTAANPRLKGSVQSTILYAGDSTDVDKPCVLMRNDTNYCGLLPLFNRYASQLTENDISIRSAQINARAQVGIEAASTRDKEAARKYIDDLEAGKLAVIGETAFLDGLRLSNISTQSSNTVIQLIELQQYLKASWYNELGLNVNFNMKREYMSEEEIAVNTDILLPLVDDMLKCRVEACNLINEVFGTNISVRKSSAWANKEQEELAALSEASMQGQIPLKETIANKIEGDFEDGEESSVETKPEVQQEAVPSVQNEMAPEEAQPEQAGESGAEAYTGDESARTPDVTVEVKVEVKEGDADGGDISDESEAPEKSEESDSESGSS